MGKILAALGAILLVWVMYPHVRAGEWLAPTPLPPDTWLAAQAPAQYAYMTKPEAGYGWFRFDFWNNPQASGRTVYTSDFRL